MRFSVIIPVYNVAAYLGDCLGSLLSQSCPDWEAICVDDGSDDASASVLDGYAAKDPRIRVVRQKRTGVGGARNAGLAAATGEWILFLDGDDALAPTTLAYLSEVCLRNPAEDLVRFGFRRFADGEPLPSAPRRAGVPEVISIAARLSQEDADVYLWQFAFRRTLIAGLSFARYVRGEDRVFVTQVLCGRAKSFVAIGEDLYFYRQRPGSAMASRTDVRALMDELSHRLDLVSIFDTCGKEVSYRGVPNLEGYCLYHYLHLAEDASVYTSDERRMLVDWFYHELPRMCQRRGYSVAGKICARLYWVFRGRWGRWFVRCCVSRLLRVLSR